MASFPYPTHFFPPNLPALHVPAAAPSTDLTMQLHVRIAVLETKLDHSKRQLHQAQKSNHFLVETFVAEKATLESMQIEKLGIVQQRLEKAESERFSFLQELETLRGDCHCRHPVHSGGKRGEAQQGLSNNASISAKTACISTCKSGSSDTQLDRFERGTNDDSRSGSSSPSPSNVTNMEKNGHRDLAVTNNEVDPSQSATVLNEPHEKINLLGCMAVSPRIAFQGQDTTTVKKQQEPPKSKKTIYDGILPEEKGFVFPQHFVKPKQSEQQEEGQNAGANPQYLAHRELQYSQPRLDTHLESAQSHGDHFLPKAYRMNRRRVMNQAWHPYAGHEYMRHAESVPRNPYVDWDGRPRNARTPQDLDYGEILTAEDRLATNQPPKKILTGVKFGAVPGVRATVNGNTIPEAGSNLLPMPSPERTSRTGPLQTEPLIIGEETNVAVDKAEEPTDLYPVSGTTKGNLKDHEVRFEARNAHRVPPQDSFGRKLRSYEDSDKDSDDGSTEASGKLARPVTSTAKLPMASWSPQLSDESCTDSGVTSACNIDHLPLTINLSIAHRSTHADAKDEDPAQHDDRDRPLRVARTGVEAQTTSGGGLEYCDASQSSENGKDEQSRFGESTARKFNFWESIKLKGELRNNRGGLRSNGGFKGEVGLKEEQSDDEL